MAADKLYADKMYVKKSQFSPSPARLGLRSMNTAQAHDTNFKILMKQWNKMQPQ